MPQTELGAAVTRFIKAIPGDLLPPKKTLDAIYRALEGDFGPQDSAVVSLLLGPAFSWGSELNTKPRKLVWPEDHGMHMDIANGWYYLVSNLKVVGEEGVRIAVITIPMRTTSVPRVIREELDWSPLDAQVVDSNVKMTLVTPDGSVNVRRELNVQAGIDDGLELEYQPFRVVVGGDSLVGGEDDPFPLDGQMHAHYEGDSKGGPVTIDLNHQRIEAYFLEGDEGYVPITDKAGYLYYSAAQLQTTGMITYAGRQFEVTGVSWFDHQWGVEPPEPEAADHRPLPALPARASGLIPAGAGKSYIGWVWFAFNFEDGTSLTLAGALGSLQPRPPEIFVWGKIVQGETARATVVDGYVSLTDYMTSPQTGAEWPCGWEFKLHEPEAGESFPITMKATPWAKDQLGMFASLQEFWEGGADVVGWDLPVGEPGVILNGVGFCEAVGYEPADSYVKRALEFLEREPR